MKESSPQTNHNGQNKSLSYSLDILQKQAKKK
jgi:hypothetical protein